MVNLVVNVTLSLVGEHMSFYIVDTSVDYIVTNDENNKAFSMDKSISYYESGKCESEVIYQVYLSYGLFFERADNRKLLWSLMIPSYKHLVIEAFQSFSHFSY